MIACFMTFYNASDNTFHNLSTVMNDADKTDMLYHGAANLSDLHLF